MAISTKNLWAMCAVAITSGCAGTVGGQIDGKDVPAFGSLAFGEGDITGGGVFVIGVGVPGNSCAFGGDYLPALFDGIAASRENDAQALENAQNDIADAVNAAVKVDDWLAQITISAEDDSDIRDETIDFSDDTPSAAVSFSLCRQKDEAEVKDGVLDSGADCFSPSDGEFTLTHTDDNKLVLQATDEVKFVDEDGDTAGRATFEFNFSRCTAMDDAVEDFIDDAEAANAGG